MIRWQRSKSLCGSRQVICIEIIAADKSPYGAAERETFDVILKLARMEGLIADPVYEGKAVRGFAGTGGRWPF